MGYEMLWYSTVGILQIRCPPHNGKRFRISSCFRFHYRNVNGFKWCGMDSNGMFMPCPSGAGQLAIYLGSAHDTNRLPATTLGKIYWKYTGEKRWKRVGKTAKYLGSAEERTPTKWLAGWPCLKICTKIVCTLTFLRKNAESYIFAMWTTFFVRACQQLYPTHHALRWAQSHSLRTTEAKKPTTHLIDEAASHCPRFFGWPFNLTGGLSEASVQLKTSTYDILLAATLLWKENVTRKRFLNSRKLEDSWHWKM